MIKTILTPESESLWIINPEILLLSDSVIMDKSDYDRIQLQSDRSSHDRKLAILLKAYYEQELVELIDYKSLMRPVDRKTVHILSARAQESASIDLLKNTAFFGHQQFAGYLGAKLTHLNTEESYFRSVAKAWRRTNNFMRTISELDQDQPLPSSIAEMQRRAIAKWLAGEIIAYKAGASALHDLDEYRPYAKLIRETVLKNAFLPIPAVKDYYSHYSAPIKVFWNMLKTKIPGFQLESINFISELKKCRKEFEAFRRVIKDLIRFYSEVHDEDLLKRYAQNRINESQSIIDNKMNSFPAKLRRGLPSALNYLLNKVELPQTGDLITEHVKKAQALELFEKTKDCYQKICCFSIYASSREVVSKGQSLTKNDFEKDHGFWITGAALPWYEHAIDILPEEEIQRSS